MGCGASVHVMNEIETPIVHDTCDSLAGKFNRVKIPKDIWLFRMRNFISEHAYQLKHYGAYEVDVMYRKLHSYEISVSNTNKGNKHSQAVKVVSGILRTIPAPSPKQIRDELTTMSVDYCIEDKQHEFEEIIFVFSIIINAPMIQFYETKY